MKFWDVSQGRLIRSIDGIGIGFLNALICANEKIVLIFLERKIQAISFDNGALKYSINERTNKFSCNCVAGPKKNQLAIGKDTSIQLYDTVSGTALELLTHPDSSVVFNGLAVGKQIIDVLLGKCRGGQGLASKL